MTPAYEFLDATPDFRGLAVAVGVGLLVGLERERRHGNDGIEHVAGIRTFALLAVVGVVSSWLGVVAQAMVLFAVASLAVIAYVRETSGDRGLTTEVAMLAITLLGMLSTPYPEWSAGLGVLVAVLLAAKTTMHRFSRQVLTAGEVRDGLILAAAVLVVRRLPLPGSSSPSATRATPERSPWDQARATRFSNWHGVIGARSGARS